MSLGHKAAEYRLELDVELHGVIVIGRGSPMRRDQTHRPLDAPCARRIREFHRESFGI